jgi:hypothetical protein
MCADRVHRSAVRCLVRHRGVGGPRRKLRGQALVETLVGALVLVPLVLLVIWLGKVQAIRQASIAASRTLAFECTVRPDDCAVASAHPELVDELRRRAFSRADSEILTGDRLPDDAPREERNPLYTDRANRSLIERFSDIGVRVDVGLFDAGSSVAASRAGAIAGNAAQVLSELAGPGRFGLALDGGLVDAKVQANVSSSAGTRDFTAQLDSIALRVKAHTAILTDAWNASGPYDGPRSVAARVDQGRRVLDAWEATVDARYLPVRGFIGLMNAVGLEPAGDAFRYHEVDVDVVPGDRVGGAGQGAQVGSDAGSTGAAR